MLTMMTANLAGRVRRVVKDGRAYLVAPMTLLQEGVLSGSKGALFYPSSEIGKTVKAWDGQPLTLGHPYAGGQHISAQTPGVQSIGHVRRPALNGPRQLGAEGWFDEELTRRADPNLLDDIESGLPIELSTGLFTDNVPAPLGSSFGGRSYTHVALNHRPDHVAILRGQRGACSLDDGCGVNVNNTLEDRAMSVWNWLRDRSDLTVNCYHDDDEEPTMNDEDVLPTPPPPTFGRGWNDDDPDGPLDVPVTNTLLANERKAEVRQAKVKARQLRDRERPATNRDEDDDEMPPPGRWGG